MTGWLPDAVRRERRRARTAEAWIAWVRVLAAPFPLLEAATEDYPPGHEPWAWVLAGAFAAGAVFLFAAERRALTGRAATPLGAAALVFDTAFLSGWAVLYGFDAGTPARDLLVLAPLEAALRYGRAGALWAGTTIPALAVFEHRLSSELDVPYQLSHAINPAALYLLVALLVGALRDRALRV